MTKDDIIRMAREAGWSGLYVTYNAPTGKADWKMVEESLTVPVTMEQIERFVALVAAKERESCAALAEKTICDTHITTGVKIYGSRAAAAIRSRGQS